MSGGRISGFQPLEQLSGEVWLEVIYRPSGIAPWQHRRVSGSLIKGQSAYELALEAGFQGTLEEWLESLKATPPFAEYNVGLITARELPLRADQTVELPQLPYGGLVHDAALLHLDGGSCIEIIGARVEVRDNRAFVILPPEDLASLQIPVHAVTVSFLGDLP